MCILNEYRELFKLDENLDEIMIENVIESCE